MAIYLVSPLFGDRMRLDDQLPFAVVSAGSEADAVAIAKDYRATGLSAAAWESADVIELVDVVGDDADAYEGMELFIQVQGAPSTFVVQAASTLSVTSAIVAANGSGYSEDDVLTLAGGTFTRAATFKVLTVSTGAVATIAVLDAGDYSVLPTGTQATTVAPPGGTGCTLTPSGDGTSLASLLSRAVTLLNARADIAGASVDMSAAPYVLTVADASDALGDKTLVVKMLPRALLNGAGNRVNRRFPIPGLVGTITHEGASGDALTVEFPDSATAVIPRVLEIG